MIAVRLPEELEDKLNQFAHNADKTKTDVVKDALKLFFETQAQNEEQTPYTLGQAFFGLYESGKSDLSSSYKEKLKDKISAKYHTHR